MNDAPDSFEIVAGARRYSAARQVGLLLVPCRVLGRGPGLGFLRQLLAGLSSRR